jgi:hypothetical protein
LPSTDARAFALSEAWHYGEAWRHPDVCDAHQRAWLQRVRGWIDAGEQTSAVQRWGRQVGKSWSGIAFDLCEMQRRPGIIVRYAALTAKSCAAIVVPTFESLAATMPRSILPRLNEQKGTIRAPNGSELVFAGTDNEQFDRLRGPRSHIIDLDESAFYADLVSVENALVPQLQTTNGIVVYRSSPPESPAHPFTQRDAAAQATGHWTKATVHDNPRLGVEGVARIAAAEAERLGLTLEQLFASSYWRREYLAEMVTEEGRAALPAWTDEAAALLTQTVERPAQFDAYEAHDPGKTGDPHGSLFGFHDFANNRLVIEDELEFRSAVTHIGAWAVEIKTKEAELWGVSRWEGTLSGATHEHLKKHNLDELFLRTHSATAPRQPWLRVGDDDARVTVDMALQHGIAVLPSEKHDKALWVDTVNQLIRERRLIIHPRCVRLLAQMRSTLWNVTRSRWERTDKDHGDLIDCLVYMCRAVQWMRDCRPPPPVDRGLVEAQRMMNGRPGMGLEALVRLRTRR